MGELQSSAGLYMKLKLNNNSSFQMFNCSCDWPDPSPVECFYDFIVISKNVYKGGMGREDLYTAWMQRLNKPTQNLMFANISPQVVC